MNKKIELARKLKALAEGGVEGEKENAQDLLMQYLLKNNLTLEDIEDEPKQEYLYVGVHKEVLGVFICLVESIIKERLTGNSFLVGKPGHYYLKLTQLQQAELSDKWPEYRKAFVKEEKRIKEEAKKKLKHMTIAFYSKHNLTRAPLKNEEESESESKLTQAEIAEILKMRAEMESLNLLKKLD